MEAVEESWWWWWWATDEGEHKRVPEEVALTVASFLDLASLANFSLVCRSCHRLTLDDHLW